MRVAMGQSRLLGNLVSTLLRPWIVASHHPSTTVAEGDRPGQGLWPPWLETAYEQ